jgi:hypothetical protein
MYDASSEVLAGMGSQPTAPVGFLVTSGHASTAGVSVSFAAAASGADQTFSCTSLTYAPEKASGGGLISDSLVQCSPPHRLQVLQANACIYYFHAPSGTWVTMGCNKDSVKNSDSLELSVPASCGPKGKYHTQGQAEGGAVHIMPNWEEYGTVNILSRTVTVC